MKGTSGKRWKRVLWGCWILGWKVLLEAEVPAPPPLILQVGEEKRLPVQGAIRYVVRGPAGIVEVTLAPDALLLRGKKEGEVDLDLWSRDEKGTVQRTAYHLQVGRAPLPPLAPPAAKPAEGKSPLEQAREALQLDPLTAGQEIRLEEEKGLWVLRGTVSSLEVARRAEELVKKWAPALHNELSLRAPSSEEAALEQEILQRYGVKVALRRVGSLWVVEGEVPTRSLQKEIPQFVALKTRQSVRNRLLLVPGPPTVLVTLPLPEGEAPRVGVPFGPPIQLAVGHSEVVRAPGPIRTAEIANPEVADIVIPPSTADALPTDLVVSGKKEGTTTLHIWYESPQEKRLKVVGHPVEVYRAEPEEEVVAPPSAPPPPPSPPFTAKEIEDALRQVGLEGIQVLVVEQDGGRAIVLYGKVQRQEDAQRAQTLAEAYLPSVQAQAAGAIKNLIEVTPPPPPPEKPPAPPLEPEKLRSEISRTLALADVEGVEVKIVERVGGGWSVLLLGEVESQEVAQRAEKITRAFFGEEAGVEILSTLQVRPSLPPIPIAPPSALAPPPSPEEQLGQKITEAIALPGVTARVVGKRVILEGEVERPAQKAAAEQIARDLSQLPVENLIRVTRVPQIATDVTIVEISESALKQLGLDWGTIAPRGVGGAGAPGGAPGVGAPLTNVIGSGRTGAGEVAPGSSFRRLDPIGFQLQALVQAGQAQILQRPSVVADSGESTTINIGGELPIPQAQIGLAGAVAQTVQFRPYGVTLTLTATLEENGEILVQVTAEITELDYGNAITIGTTVIPATTRRGIETALHVVPGDTLVIGGLIGERETKNVAGIPFLKDIPLVGELFKTRERRRQRLMLVFFLTPRVLEQGV